ncbi:MAG: helix-turn-helix domain-containing protein [Methylovulum sp.]|uniref:winged helix-turn-helix transcriptional regulator n=1 Tax=Methylovulum sp. TaxID=1916980 RepID=UPI0026120701|nr:helix-turn-helix domain-containing protein [Methylovulum sp.]MDD2723323.1 helix-turn-helix domain-containing protein [Methylovulum sp.]MDD5125712.1 helix-turn-helix domain-containing protein [Methylovulum sp.]
MKTETQNYRSKCPLSIALEFIGDKWSLIIIRDMCLGKSKYCDFQASSEGIPTNILANRLRELEENGLLVKRPYQDKPVRYEYFLTPKGADLLPVLQQLVIWTQKYVSECMAPPEDFFTIKPEDLLNRINRVGK